MNTQFEWSDGGRELPYVDEHTPYYKCVKDDCWFCEMMGIKEQPRYPEKKVYIKSDNPYLDRPARPNPKQIRVNIKSKARKIDY